MTLITLKKITTETFLPFIFLILAALSLKALADDSKDDKAEKEPESPCNGLLSLVNRPSFADSACVVPMDHAVFEMGAQFLSLNEGYGLNIPSLQARFGLPGNNEAFFFVPTFLRVTEPVMSGFGPAAFGMKHELAHSKSWVASLEGIVITPSGSGNFGSDGYGGIINGIYSYNITSKLNILIQLGGSTLTTSRNAGGKRFNSFNQNISLAFQPNEKVQFYTEVFGQTHTAPDQGAGYIVDGGIQYLIRKNIMIDLEVGQRISGNIGGIKNFIGTGLAFEV